VAKPEQKATRHVAAKATMMHQERKRHLALERLGTSGAVAAWLGLTPLQRSTGGKQKLGGTSKRGERTIRRLLIIGASAVVRWAARKGAPAGSWLERMLARKPRMLVAVALANKMARIIWALLAKGGIYRASIVAT
jgi:transposase